MANYDFSTINDKEFEELVNALISRRDSVNVESYKPGRDKGIDGRTVDKNGNVTIIQSKHWLKSGINALIRELKNNEVKKVKLLNPSKYILATSLPLSHQNKEELKLAFSPYIIDISDVLGSEDVNFLLQNNEDIELRYYNLWINSTSIITRMLNNATHVRSNQKLNNIIENNNVYVKTQAHTSSEEMLERNNIILITGTAGIGKTTLAEQLCKIYSSRDYSFYYIVNGVNEIDSIYNETEKQVYFYDDFLGSNYLKIIENKEDVMLTHLIERIRGDSTKKLILTTRTNILNQSSLLTELFERVKLPNYKIEVKVDTLSRIEKAKILYNHIWFGNLNELRVEELTKDERYFKVIDHVGFNPRLIQFITDTTRVEHVSSGRYWDYVLNTLSNPRDIWKHVLDNQTNSLCNHLTVGLVLSGGEMRHKEMNSFFYNLIGTSLHSDTNESLEDSIRLLTGSLVNVNIGDNNSVSYKLFNPSISDFIFSVHSNNWKYLSSIVTLLKSSRALKTLIALKLNNIISVNVYDKCIESISSINHDDLELTSFHLVLSSQIIKNAKSGINDNYRNYLTYISSIIFNYDYVSSNLLVVILGLIKFDIIKKTNENLHEFVEDILTESFNDTYFIELSHLLEKIGVLNDDNYEKLTENIHHYYDKVTLTDIIIDSDVYRDFYNFESIYNDSYHKVIEILDEDLSELKCPVDDEVHDLVFDLSRNCDLEAIIEYNVERSDYEPRGYQDANYSLMVESSDYIRSYYRNKN